MKVDIESKQWTYAGGYFNVMVKRWCRPDVIENIERTRPAVPDIMFKYKWNIYAYIFPDHNLFDAIENDNWFNYGIELPFNNIVSLHEWYYNKLGKVIIKEIGCDYQNIGDKFGDCKTKEEARPIFDDADKLIAALSN